MAASLAVEDEEKVQQKLALHPRMGWKLLYDCEDSRPSIMRTIGGCQAVAIMQPACFGGAHLSIGEFVQARGAGFAVLDAHASLPCSKVLPCCSKVLLLMAHACILIYRQIM